MDTFRMDNEKYIYLTTKGRQSGRPHTVELWYACVNETIYLSHEGTNTDWMKNILKENRVTFRIGYKQCTGKAHLVNDEKACEVGKHALYLKYYGKASEDTINDWFSESTIIEIAILEEEVI